VADHKLLRPVLQAGVLLALSALTGTGVMAVTHYYTAGTIAENQHRVLINSLNNVLPGVQYDNDPSKDFVMVKDRQLLGSGKPLIIYRARHSGKPSAAIITSVAPDGYGGPITIIVGIRYDGVICGVRVVDHHETPGLGDAIDTDHSRWIFDFDHRSRENTASSQWQVKKDGGVFDQFAGATITPRAVVKAVRNSLQYFERHRTDIFAVADKTG
jgi:electron transport complex protein RnfG